MCGSEDEMTASCQQPRIPRINHLELLVIKLVLANDSELDSRLNGMLVLQLHSPVLKHDEYIQLPPRSSYNRT